MNFGYREIMLFLYTAEAFLHTSVFFIVNNEKKSSVISSVTPIQSRKAAEL